MNAIPKITESELPEEGLRFFHGLSNWVESTKGAKLQLIEWKKGQKQLSLLNSYKPKQKEPLSVPKDLLNNSLYVPNWSSGRYVISQLRHAFCHGNMKYDDKSEQYLIDLTDNVHITGKFTLEAIREFVEIYLQPKETKNKS